VVLTSWVSRPQISCRSCGMKSQAGGALFSLVLGWWGFPWGLVMTPVQVGRDIAGLAKGPDPMKPSPQLEKMVRMNMAATAFASQRTPQATSYRRGVPKPHHAILGRWASCILHSFPRIERHDPLRIHLPA